MKAGMKLATVYVATAILIAGYGQSNSASAGTTPNQPVAAQSQPSQSSQQKSSANSVDGYKSFKFGMKPSELAQLAECAPFNDLYAMELKRLEDKPEQWKAKEDELKKEEDKLKATITQDQLYPMIEANEKRLRQINNERTYTPEENKELENIRARLDELKRGERSTPTRANIASYMENIKNERREIDALRGALQADIDTLKANKETYYARLLLLHCSVSFAGNQQPLYFTFNDQKQLSSLGLSLGTFNRERLNSLIKGLQEKYPLSSAPSDVTLATFYRDIFNQDNMMRTVSWFFADNSVELRVSKGNVSSNDVFGKGMSMHYHDAISAKEAFKQSQKGQVSSGDL